MRITVYKCDRCDLAMPGEGRTITIPDQVTARHVELCAQCWRGLEAFFASKEPGPPPREMPESPGRVWVPEPGEMPRATRKKAAKKKAARKKAAKKKAAKKKAAKKKAAKKKTAKKKAAKKKRSWGPLFH